jgi:hypothetical protein
LYEILILWQEVIFMRVQVTRKQIVDNHYCIAVGYCQLQHLLAYAKSPYYTAGVYGWNFDAYIFEYKGYNVAICTGYRGMPGISIPYAMEKEFDNKAEKILADNEGNKRERLDALIQEFIATVLPNL